MNGKRFTDEQIIAILNEHEGGVSAADLARRQGFQRSVLGKRGQILQRMWPSFCFPVADKMLVNQGLR